MPCPPRGGIRQAAQASPRRRAHRARGRPAGALHPPAGMRRPPSAAARQWPQTDQTHSCNRPPPRRTAWPVPAKAQTGTACGAWPARRFFLCRIRRLHKALRKVPRPAGRKSLRRRGNFPPGSPAQAAGRPCPWRQFPPPAAERPRQRAASAHPPRCAARSPAPPETPRAHTAPRGWPQAPGRAPPSSCRCPWGPAQTGASCRGWRRTRSAQSAAAPACTPQRESQATSGTHPAPDGAGTSFLPLRQPRRKGCQTPP